MSPTNTTERLAQLRERMRANEVDVYIIPSEDSHQSEYIAACDARREFISGFSGSAGTAVVTHDKAALATDGRYFNQAEKQLDQNWLLLRQGMQDVPNWEEWVAEHAEGNKTVGVDPALITASSARKLRERIRKKGGKDLKGVRENLVDSVWSGKPARPNEPVRALDVKFCGKESLDKIADLRKELEKRKSAGMIVSMLDEIAWLFNLRGNDIDYNPVFFSYAIVTPTRATLYVDDNKLTEDVRGYLDGICDIKPYDAVFHELEALARTSSTDANSEDSNTAPPRSRYLISTKASWALSEALGGKEAVEETRSPVGDAKAIKNAVELEGMRQCHIRDGAALIEFFAWLEDQLTTKKTTLDEITAADKLEQIRSKRQHFVGLSFDTISSSGANAAVIHYKPERGDCSVVDPTQIYLCDSGAQYLDGTTDTTRTLHFGNPTDLERKAYTLVLKGMIALELMTFPKGSSGFALDMAARQFLWKEGLDYRHGTGHGVGSFLNVHEGPIGIGTRAQYTEVALSAGNVISDEPGYYEDGKFGIRIENIVMVREVKLANAFGDKPWLGFEHATMVPLCRKLIDTALLTDGEIKYLNDYHQEVYNKTHGFFDGNGENDTLALAWLKRETAPYLAVRASLAGL